jgi:hypothetical protein
MTAIRIFTRITAQFSRAAAAAGSAPANDQFGYTVVVSGDTAVVGAPFEDSSTKRIDSTRDEGAGQASIVSLREDSLTLVFDRGQQPAGNDKNSQRVGKLNPSRHSHLLAKLPFPHSTRIPTTPQS